MEMRALRRRCERILDGVPLPDPFDVDVFARTVAVRRGRRLELLAKKTQAGPCGVWIALPDADYVFYENGTSVVHREHIILHELGHLLGEHEAHERIDDAVLAELLPSLDLNVVRLVLGRTSYNAVEEQEAELLASLVLERAARRTPSARRRDHRHGHVIDRLTVTLHGESPR